MAISCVLCLSLWMQVNGSPVPAKSGPRTAVGAIQVVGNLVGSAAKSLPECGSIPHVGLAIPGCSPPHAEYFRTPARSTSRLLGRCQHPQSHPTAVPMEERGRLMVKQVLYETGALS